MVWLLLFYSVPVKLAKLRMRVWRRLMKLGAIPLIKGSAYILPFTEERREKLRELVEEVCRLHGEAAFVKVDGVENVSDKDIEALFIKARDEDYSAIESRFADLETKVGQIQKPLTGAIKAAIHYELEKLYKEYSVVKGIDFFNAPKGFTLGDRLKRLRLSLNEPGAGTSPLESHSLWKKEDYQNRTWVTHEKPSLDAVASAWLIQRFIDPGAKFKFLAEENGDPRISTTVPFAISEAVFCRYPDHCTFRVLLDAFSLRDTALNQIAEIVQELEFKSGNSTNPLAIGLKTMLAGISKPNGDDFAFLTAGAQVFDQLYAAVSRLFA